MPAMSKKNARVLENLNSNRILLAIQMQGQIARIKGIDYSLEFHLQNGGSESDKYVTDLRRAKERAEQEMASLFVKLHSATLTLLKKETE
jgi:hypothetical protein